MRSTSILFTSVFVALSGAGCSNGGPSGTATGSNGGSTSGTSGGSDGGYTLIPIDPMATGSTTVAIGDGGTYIVPGGKEILFNMAIGANDQIGVVYYRTDPDGGQKSGFPNQDVVYAEVQNGAITVQPEQVSVVQLPLGCTVAFQPSGMPAIGYLGGGEYDGETPDSGLPTGSTYWVQSQAEIDYRTGTNAWTKDICMVSSMGGSCEVGTSACNYTPGAGGPFNWKIFDGASSTEDTEAEAIVDNPFGSVIGLWPSLLFDGGTAVMAVRDVHEGQFPIQDWGGSDTKMCIGGPGATDWSWSAPLTISASGAHETNGFGVHNQILYANGVLAEIADSDPKDEGVDNNGSGPISFTMQRVVDGGISNTQTNADWTTPINPFDPSGTANFILDPETGPSMVFSSTFGFGVAAVDTLASSGPNDPITPALYYVSSADGVNWGTPELVAQNGSSGFYPSLQVDPVNGNPIISYLICSLEPGATPETGCSRTDAQLDVAEPDGEGNWNATPIMNGSFYHPRFGYLSTGKKVFVYADLFNGGLYVAIEN